MLLLGDILRRHATVRGDKTAYVVGAEHVTYGDFHSRSNQLAHALMRLGVRRGDRVAVMAANRIEYPVFYFAVIKLGAIVVPINARFTAAEIGSVVDHSQAETFCVAREFAPLIEQLRGDGQLGGVRRFLAIDDDGALRDAPLLAALSAPEQTDDVVTPIDEQDPHVMLYTSGTTGSPKGTLVSQRS